MQILPPPANDRFDRYGVLFARTSLPTAVALVWQVMPILSRRQPPFGPRTNVINLPEIKADRSPGSLQISLGAARAVLAAVLAVSLVALLTVRFLDGRRDRHDTTLLSLTHLGDLLGRDDAATSSLQGTPSAARAADLRSTRGQIAERLSYLGRLGLDRARLQVLEQGMARYHDEADRALAGPGRGDAQALTDDVARLRAAITQDSDREKSAFATYDVALDSLTVAFLVAAVVGAAGGAWWVHRRSRDSN